MISFKAHYINSISINRISTNTPVTTSFVELNPKCVGDISCVQDISSSWELGGTFAKDIEDHFLDCNWIGFNNGKRFFALTMQRSNFENLEPYEVLGIAQITDDNTNQIEVNYLQTDPTNKYLAPNREFSNIGKIILDSIRKVFNKNIILKSTESAKKFYKKYGFERIKRSSNFILRSKS